jgi:hypothetical protein
VQSLPVRALSAGGQAPAFIRRQIPPYELVGKSDFDLFPADEATHFIDRFVGNVT